LMVTRHSARRQAFGVEERKARAAFQSKFEFVLGFAAREACCARSTKKPDRQNTTGALAVKPARPSLARAH
jgi:hypothetical protein